MFIHYTMAGLSPTEGVIMLPPLIAGGAGGTCEKSSAVIVHVCSEILLAPPPLPECGVLLILVMVVMWLSRNRGACSASAAEIIVL